MSNQVAPITILSTFDTLYVRMVTHSLISQGLIPEHLFLGSTVAQKMFQWRSIQRVWQRHGLREVFYRFSDRRAERPEPKNIPVSPTLSKITQQYDIGISTYDFLNSGKFLADLSEYQNEIIILAGCGIVSAWVASMAEIACINAHPAILPGARGVDVIEWSLLYDHPLGVSAHVVLPKVDAGDILFTEALTPDSTESLGDFKTRVEIRQAEALATAARDLLFRNESRQRNDLALSQLYFVTNHADRLKSQEIYKKNFR